MIQTCLQYFVGPTWTFSSFQFKFESARSTIERPIKVLNTHLRKRLPLIYSRRIVVYVIVNTL